MDRDRVTVGKKLIYHGIVNITELCPEAEVQVLLAFLQYDGEWPFFQIVDCYKGLDGLQLRESNFYFREVAEKKEPHSLAFQQLARRFNLTPEALAAIIQRHTPDSYRKACLEQ